MRWDFVETYKGYMKKITDAPDEFFEASALYLISTFVGRNFVFITKPDISIFSDEPSGRLLNLWFVIIGKSRVARKTTVITKAEEYIDEIAPQIKLPIDFTPESFVHVMAEKTVDNITHATWIHDEVSGFFTALKKKDYMVSIDAIMSKIYDGKTYYRSTISRGKEVIKYPYFTILVGSTDYLPSTFSEDYLRQGFLNRFIYVVAKRKRWKKLDTGVDQELINEMRALGDWLRLLFDFPMVMPMNFDSNAKTIYDRFEQEVETTIENEDLGIKEGYYGNLPNIVLKLSGIYRISRMTTTELMNYARPILIINEEDVLRAIEYAEKMKKWFDDVITLMKVKAKSKQVETHESDLEYLKYILRQHGGQMKKTELLRASKWAHDKFVQVLSTLISREEVVITKGASSGGRKPDIIKLVR